MCIRDSDFADRYSENVREGAKPLVAGMEKKAADKQRALMFDAAGKLPENKRAAAYKQAGVDFGSGFELPSLSEPDRKSFEHHYDKMRADAVVADANRVNSLYSNLVSALKKPKQAGESDHTYGLRQLAALNNFWKMSDDGVVRSDDVKLVGLAQGLGARITNYYDQISKGQVYNAKLSDAMAEVATDIMNGLNAHAEQSLNDYVTSLEGSNIYSPAVTGGLSGAVSKMLTRPQDIWGVEAAAPGGGAPLPDAEPYWFTIMTPEQQKQYLDHVKSGGR
jgi:hypothetical protein